MTTANDKLPRVITRTTVFFPREEHYNPGSHTTNFRNPEPLYFTDASMQIVDGCLVVQADGLATIFAAGFWSSAFTARQDG